MKNQIENIKRLSHELTTELLKLHFANDTQIIDKNQTDYITIPLGISFNDMNKIIIENTLKHFNNNQSKTAKSLGIGRVTLYRHIKDYDIKI